MARFQLQRKFVQLVRQIFECMLSEARREQNTVVFSECPHSILIGFKVYPSSSYPTRAQWNNVSELLEQQQKRAVLGGPVRPGRSRCGLRLRTPQGQQSHRSATRCSIDIVVFHSGWRRHVEQGMFRASPDESGALGGYRGIMVLD